MTQLTTRTFPAEIPPVLTAAGISPLLARIYAARGIAVAAELDTALASLLPVSRLKQADEMARQLCAAIAAGKKLLVVADYDADGATACAVAVRGLRLFGANVEFIVPNRFEYGYGLTPEIVRLAAGQQPDVLLTVDNGIASVDGVNEASRLGIQVLVTDHHLPGDQLPSAACIVNPNQPGCEFPSKHLAGVGVMFYVLLALRAELRARGAFADGRAEPNLANLLDLVALGTVADVVRLDQNNRILVQQGLARIRAGRASPGIQALLQVARKLPAQASAYELGFIVGPRLNAAGRLEDMSLGIRCLLTDDAAEAAQLAQQLDALNRTRRDIEADMQQAALAALETIDPTEGYSLTLYDADWHQGVIGILASRLKDKFHRPVIVFAAAGDGWLKGSGRSIAGLHLRDALDWLSKRQPGLIEKFGGHAMAAGLTIHADRFAEFQRGFEKAARVWLPESALTKVLETDGELTVAELSLESARALAQPVWGQGFPAPLFQGEFAVLQQRVVGEKHLKLRLGFGGGSFEAMRFFSAEPLSARIRAAYQLSCNEFNGQTSLQLILEHCEALE